MKLVPLICKTLLLAFVLFPVFGCSEPPFSEPTHVHELTIMIHCGENVT